MPVVRYKQAVTVVALVLALAFILLRLWQGPEVPGYRIEPMPLVQTVVATGRPQAKVALTRAEVELDQAIRETERRRSLADRSSLSTEALEQAEQQEILARNAVETARLALTALATGSTEETRLREQLASLQAKLARTVIRAEVAGTVLTRNVEPGDLVQPGRVLFTIALSSDTEIRVPLDEKNLSLLSPEQNAGIVADA